MFLVHTKKFDSGQHGNHLQKGLLKNAVTNIKIFQKEYMLLTISNSHTVWLFIKSVEQKKL